MMPEIQRAPSADGHKRDLSSCEPGDGILKTGAGEAAIPMIGLATHPPDQAQGHAIAENGSLPFGNPHVGDRLAVHEDDAKVLTGVTQLL